MDLKFPHHENENAQYRALEGEDIANIWMHNGFINIDGEKMSKSLGNFITVKKLMEQYGTNTIRLLVLQTNYRQPINLTEEFIQQTQKLTNKIEDYMFGILESEYILFLKMELDEEIVSIMNDDFNTPNLISLLIKSIKDNESKIYSQITSILGLKLNCCILLEDAELDVKKLIQDFEKYKNEKDFEKVDEVKLKIKNLGYEIQIGRTGLKIKKGKEENNG